MIKTIVPILALTVVMEVPASPQTPKIPEAQAKFCQIEDNWKYRGGYAPGAVPKVDSNPIRAARAPKPASPGDFFDQIIEVFGTSGSFTGWKGEVGYNITDQKLNVSIYPFCPGPNSKNFTISLMQVAIPLTSPIADFLANRAQYTMATFSGRTLYDPERRFYRHYSTPPFEAWPRSTCPLCGTERYLNGREEMLMELSNLSK